MKIWNCLHSQMNQRELDSLSSQLQKVSCTHVKCPRMAPQLWSLDTFAVSLVSLRLKSNVNNVYLYALTNTVQKPLISHRIKV